MTESSNQKRKIINKVVIHVESDPDDTDIQASNKHNIEIIKDQVIKIFDYSGNINKYPPDGTIVITPRYLENLPNEILDLILFYLCNERRSKSSQQSLQNDLYQCSLVSKQFYQGTNRLLWHTPVISNVDILDRFVTGLTNTQIIQQATNLSDGIYMANKKVSHHPVPHNILLSKHHIRQLDVIDGFWDNLQLTVVMTCVHLLETLIIKDGKKESNITETVLHYLPRYCPYIITLSLVPILITQASCFNGIVQHCDQLRKLELCIKRNTQQCHDGVFDSLVRCPSLTILNLYFRQDYLCKSHLTHDTIQKITKLHQLTTIAFIDENLSSTVAKNLCKINMTTIWPLLSSLCINRGSPLTDPFMIPFIESHPHITSLDLKETEFTDLTLDAMATHLPRLKYVRLFRNDTITPDGVYKLVRHCRYLKQAEFSGLNWNGITVFTEAQMENIRKENYD